MLDGLIHVFVYAIYVYKLFLIKLYQVDPFERPRGLARHLMMIKKFVEH